MNTQDERKAFEEWHFLDWKLNCAVLDTVEEARIIYERIYKRSNPDIKFEQEQSFRAWIAAKSHEAKKLEGCVVVPVQCPDPDFADMLFDELRKYAIGTFGDDMLIHFSNIDEEKIWALMVEAARGGNE